MYHRAIYKDLQNNVPFVPYLGFFLTQVVHQTCIQKMRDSRGMRRKGAILKRYKVLLSCTTLSDSPYKVLNTTFSCPDGCRDDFNYSIKSGTTLSGPKGTIPTLGYSYNEATTSFNAEIRNNECPKGVLFPTFSSGERVNAKKSASLPFYYHYASAHNAAGTASCPSGSLRTSSRYSTPVSPHSRLAVKCHSEELLDSQHHSEITDIHLTSPNVSISLGSLGPEAILGPGAILGDAMHDRLSDSALHMIEGSTSNISESEDHLLSSSYSKISLPPNLSSSTSSLSPESGISSPRPSTPDDDTFCRSGDSGLYSIKRTVCNSSDDESHSASISKFRVCSVSSINVIDFDEIAPPTPQWHAKPFSTKSENECSDSEEIPCSKCTTHHDCSALQDSTCPVCAKLAGKLERRRNAVQEDSVDPWFSNPKALLQRYQICSLGCGIGMQGREDIRSLIKNYHCNTETENYALSYRREPQRSMPQTSSDELNPCESTPESGQGGHFTRRSKSVRIGSSMSIL